MAQENSTQDFYAELKPFSDFQNIAQIENYSAMPDDWSLLVTDVVDSTKAIEAGHYKNVNMVGAACIIAVLNVCEGADLPFMFGGDGGLVAVPPEYLEAASNELIRLQSTSQALFGLALRAAAIPVGALRKEGAETLVGKYELSEGNMLAMFAGNGPTIADGWLKEDESKGYALVATDGEQSPDLEGLSCRWEPLKSRNGVMLTLILMPIEREGENEIVTVTEEIGQILGDDLSAFAPAHKKTMKYKFPPAGLSLEIAANALKAGNIKRIAWTYFTASMQYLCERFDIKIGDYNGATYREEVKTNTDFRKFDGSLRLVLDVSKKQANEIITFLKAEHERGRLFYGHWETDMALMTCLLFSLEDSKHVHFIDGSDGGYAMAAKELKAQLKEANG